MIYVRPKKTNLGLVPAVIGGAVAIEAAWAWYDPDVFMDVWVDADQEQQIISLNNWWAGLESTARKTVPPGDAVWDRLNGDLDAFNAWRSQYNDAILRRWLPGGRDWGDELTVWFEKFRETSSLVADAGGREAERQMQRRGIDPRLLPPEDKGFLEQAQEALDQTIEKAGEAAGEAAGGAGQNIGKGLLWPALALGASAGLLIFLATRPAPRKRRRMRA